MRIETLFSLAVLTALLASVPTPADTITIDGVTHEDVYVTESPTRYYIQVPSTGKTMSVAKSTIAPDSVQMSLDRSHRKALLHEWRTNAGFPEQQQTTQHDNDPVIARPAPDAKAQPSRNALKLAPSQRTLPASTSQATSLQKDYATNGYVQSVKLNDVELRHGLDALLRPLNLDHEVRNGHIWISTSDRIRTEPSDRLQVRIYQLNHAGGETLPKVGVSNLGGPGGTTARGGGYSSGYGNAYGGGSRRR